MYAPVLLHVCVRVSGLCARVHVAAGRHPAAMGWLWDTLYSWLQSPPFQLHHSDSPASELCRVSIFGYSIQPIPSFVLARANLSS